MHHPKDFLILFSLQDTKDRLAGDHFIHSPRFSLSMHPWCKFAHTGSDEFECHVELELRGILAQTWHLSIAEHILGQSCWIEHLNPQTSSYADLAMSRLSRRTHDPRWHSSRRHPRG